MGCPTGTRDDGGDDNIEDWLVQRLLLPSLTMKILLSLLARECRFVIV